MVDIYVIWAISTIYIYFEIFGFSIFNVLKLTRFFHLLCLDLRF